MFKFLFLGIITSSIIGCDLKTEADTSNNEATDTVVYAADSPPETAAHHITLVQGRRLVEGRRPNRYGVVSLSWTPPTLNTDESALTDLSHYTIYYGVDPNVLKPTILNMDIGLTEYIVENLDSRTKYYFSITAINTGNIESPQSNVVFKTTY